MANKVIEWVEHHPFETGGAILIVGVLALVLANSGGGSSPSVSTDNTATSAAEQLAAQNSATAAQFASQQETDSTNLAVAGLQGQVQVNSDNLAAALGMANISANQAVSLDTNATNLAITTNNNASAVLINSQNNTAQTDQINIVNATQAAITKYLSDAQVQTAVAADNLSLGIAQTNASVQKKSSSNSLWGGIAAGLLALF